MTTEHGVRDMNAIYYSYIFKNRFNEHLKLDINYISDSM